LLAIKATSKRGAKVLVLYDAIPGKGAAEENLSAIRAADIESLCKARTTGKIMHNKFFVLTKDDNPVAVWTGSTNLTENGIFGHSNFGHVVEDSKTARAYLNYFTELTSNPLNEEEKTWVAKENPAPPVAMQDMSVVFSPRKGREVLKWYAELARGGPLFMTFAFGMNEVFQDVYWQRDGVLRFALMEKAGNSERAKGTIQAIRNLPNVVLAIGNNITANAFDRWLKEVRTVTSARRVHYIHTKYMLVDPLGSAPIVLAGSGNFSPASTQSNNENMLVIRNDKRVADIYLGEFMRLHAHYGFRNSVKWAIEEGVDPLAWQPSYLNSDPRWQDDDYTPGTDRYLRRKYFART
jgi:phosphatidylserine/phosphatidylglycerophosphate/cardiolipin synthase-like enzyme